MNNLLALIKWKSSEYIRDATNTKSAKWRPSVRCRIFLYSPYKQLQECYQLR